MKILAFCFFPAFVPPSNGGQSRLYNFYRSLSRLHEITLLTSSHGGVAEERIHHGAGFIERRIPKDNYFVAQYAALDQFASGGDVSGPAIAACGCFLTKLHQAYLEEYEKADVIIHDFPFTAEYDLFAGLDDKPRIYNAHNCEATLYRQLHPEEQSSPIHKVVRQAELQMLEKSNLVLYCNEEDVVAFREMAPNSDFETLYVPNGMNALALQEEGKTKKTGRFSTVFMGSAHPPNVHAAKFIANSLAPQFPDIVFHIIGSCLSEGRYHVNVHRHGVVPDEVKMRLLGQADLALNPMAAGSGSNVKVLDYFSHALPVLSTSFGMRGIQAKSGKEYLEADLENFVDAIRLATTEPELIAGIAQAGKQLALDQYTWDTIAASAASSIEKLLNANSKTSERFVLVLNDYDSFDSMGGGGTRTRGLYDAVREWSPVVFLCFSSDRQLRVRKHINGITVICVPKSPEHQAEQDHVNALFHVAADDIVASRHCMKNPVLNVIYRTLRQHTRCVVVEHCYMAGLPAQWGDRFVYSSQNNETELKKRLLAWHPLKTELLQDVEEIERFSVECSAVTVAVSTEDAETLLRGKRTAGPVIVVRNGAEAPAQGEAVEQEKNRFRNVIWERSVVFLGSAHMPNTEAAEFITGQLASLCPDVQFHLVGSVCTGLDHVPANVRLWGVVDEQMKSAVMQSCALAINPMFSGSGSNVKLADYIGNGLFVVTTEFGQRGYPDSVFEHIDIAAIDRFAEYLRRALACPERLADDAREARRNLFSRELAMKGLAARFVDILQGLEVKRKRILYVAYRYVAPAQGGAEVNTEKFVSALGHSGKFDVDVVAPEVSGIHSHLRFSECYTFDPELSAPVDIPNVRYARFPADRPDEAVMDAGLRNAWQVQPRFERAVSAQLSANYTTSSHAWGWGYPEGEGRHASRWAFTECGLFLIEPARVVIKASTPDEIVITAYNEGVLVAGPWTVKGNFQLDMQVPAGEVEFVTSASAQKVDPRPLGFFVSRLVMADQAIDLALQALYQKTLAEVSAEKAFRILDRAAETTRVHCDVRLTDGRGPWSTAMERFIAAHVAEYDLVVTNNNVFRPAVMALAESKKQEVPSILIPHAHLDDDFYHFPDWLQSARDASLVLAVPNAAVNFLAEKCCNVRYFPAGCDATEKFTPQDVEAFRQVFFSKRQFILVLGRKAGAKGYRKIISVVEQLNSAGEDIHVVLIGPDDDGLPVNSPHATYLGRQPRNVVRGALQSCLALCNMSTSESFGIVLLEAWLAGKPVIVNRSCAAFHDMAVHGENALLVDDSSLAEAIKLLVAQPEMCEQLAATGRQLVNRFDWSTVCDQFVEVCSDLVDDQRAPRKISTRNASDKITLS